MREHSLVVLTRADAEHGLEAGDIGTVVHEYRGGEALEVEFASADAHTVAVLTLEKSDVREMAPREILHARKLRAGSR